MPTTDINSVDYQQNCLNKITKVIESCRNIEHCNGVVKYITNFQKTIINSGCKTMPNLAMKIITIWKQMDSKIDSMSIEN